MTKKDLDREAEKMSWDEQNWLFNRLMGRLWPELAGKRVVLDAVSSVWQDDDGYTEEDYEWYRKKAEEVEQKLAEEECAQ